MHALCIGDRVGTERPGTVIDVSRTLEIVTVLFDDGTVSAHDVDDLEIG